MGQTAIDIEHERKMAILAVARQQSDARPGASPAGQTDWVDYERRVRAAFEGEMLQIVRLEDEAYQRLEERLDRIPAGVRQRPRRFPILARLAVALVIVTVLAGGGIGWAILNGGGEGAASSEHAGHGGSHAEHANDAAGASNDPAATTSEPVAEPAASDGHDHAAHASAPTTSAPATTTSEAVGRTVDVELGDFFVRSSKQRVAQGSVRFDIKNTAESTPHELMVVPAGKMPADPANASMGDMHGVASLVVHDLTQGMRTAKSATATLEPGEYVLFCGIPGHYQAGQHTTLTVV